ncbi:MAG: T9SS type A sorting domain-containing protein [Chitinophagales bacterium]
MKIGHKALLTFLIIFLPLFSFAQWGDCATSKFVAGGVNVFPASLDTGNVNDLANYNGCIDDGELYSTWIIFEIDSDGYLLFDIFPRAFGSDYDFALFKLRDTLYSYCCEDIASGLLSNIRCNYAAVFQSSNDTTGLRHGYTTVSSDHTQPSFNAPLQVFAGEKYVLFTNRYYSASDSFTIDFTPSTATFLDSLSYFNPNNPDTIAPEIANAFTSLTLDSNCQRRDTIMVEFSEGIPCGSLSKEDFNISGPDSIVVSELISGPCSCNSANTVQLVLDENYPPSDSAQYFISASFSDPAGNQADSTQGVYFYSKNYDYCNMTAPTGTDCSCVWPGDINNDGIANNFDVLSLGIAYGTNGPVRQNASINWEGQKSSSWDSIFYNAVNFKHADCNGDGLVDFNDTTAISQNYNLTHNKNSQNSAQQNFIPLYVNLPDTMYVDDTVYAAIMLGNPTIFLDSLYGIAFSLLYDSSFLSNPLYLQLDTSWMGNLAQNLLGFSKNLPSMTQTDIAITRTDLQNSVGQLYGQIGTIMVVLDPDLYNKTTRMEFIIQTTNVRAIDNKENIIDVIGTPDTAVVIDPYLSALGLELANSIKLYPNPTKNQTIIDAGNTIIQRVAVTDINGKELYYKENINENRHRLNLDLPAGIYLVQIYAEEGIVTKKMVVR